MARCASQEAITQEFERKRQEAQAATESKTAKNRAKRQKKKDRVKGKGAAGDGAGDAADPAGAEENASRLPIKKRRLVSGKELVFRRQGEDEEEGEGEE